MSDWITIDENFYTPPGGFGTFGLRYNKKSGDIEIKQRNLIGGFDGPGLATLYQNDAFFSDSLRIPDLFTYAPGDILQSNPIPTDVANNLAVRARQLAFQTYQAIGGRNSGASINSAALPENQNISARIDNRVPGATPGIAGAIPGLSSPIGQGNIFDIFSPGLNVLNSDLKFLESPLQGKHLKYPIDLIKQGQDILVITQIEYKSPTQDIFKSDANINSILTEGITRKSVKKEIVGTVTLPIPNNAQDSNVVSWNDDSMNSFTAAATSIGVNNPGGLASALVGGQVLNRIPGLEGIGSQIPRAILLGYMTREGISVGGESQDIIKAGLVSEILQRYGIEVPPESILSRGAGVIPNSNLQLLFNNVTLRNFNFAYRMSPRSEEEAKEVNSILRWFKQGMAAKKSRLTAGSSTLLLSTPNVFKLEYKSGGRSIKGMNKFKICALKGFNVIYTPDQQWSAFEGGQPTSIVINMSFQEIEPIYDTDYQDNIPQDISFDLSPVAPDEIGY